MKKTAKRFVVLLGMLALILVAVAVPVLAQEEAATTVEVTFELTVEGEVLEGETLFLDLSPDIYPGTSANPDAVFCTTDPGNVAVPRCEDGRTYSQTLELPAGVELSYAYLGGEPGSMSGGSRAFTADETVSMTYRDVDPVTFGFEVEVEGEPPADATFFGMVQYRGQGGRQAQLSDPDGDGTYTGDAELYPAVGAVGVYIVQGTGTSYANEGGLFPGAPTRVIRDFGLVPTDGDRTFSAGTSFGDDGGSVVPGEIVATGLIERARSSYEEGAFYGLRDEATGRYYELTSSTAELEGYVGERVTVRGTPLPARDGQETPILLAVHAVEPVETSAGDEVSGLVRLTLNGDAPEGQEIYMRGGYEYAPICHTLRDVEIEGQTECREDGANEAPFSALTGSTVDYEIVMWDGAARTESVLAEGSEEAEEGMTVEVSYDFDDAPANPSGPDKSGNLVGGGSPDKGGSDRSGSDSGGSGSASGSGNSDGDSSGGSDSSGSSDFASGSVSGSADSGSGGSGGGGGLLSGAVGGVRDLLPSTGGGVTLAVLGAGVLLIAGGLIVRRAFR